MKKAAAAALVGVGAAALVAGAAFVYWPAALIIGGAGALAYGLFGVEVE